MDLLQLIDTTTGHILDTTAPTTTGWQYATGAARPVIDAIREARQARGQAADDRTLLEDLHGWTGDNLALQWAGAPQVPNVLLDLREAEGAAKLKAFWVAGEGAAKIRWNTSGDFNRCVRHLKKYVTDPQGLCAVYHRSATGEWPGKGKSH